MAPRVPDDACLSHFLWAKSPSPGLNADSLQGIPPPLPELEVRSLWEPGASPAPNASFPGLRAPKGSSSELFSLKRALPRSAQRRVQRALVPIPGPTPLLL